VFFFRLHMLCELEHSIKPLFHQSPGNTCQEDSLNWGARLEMTQNSYRAKEPILALRRALLSLNKRFFTLLFLFNGNYLGFSIMLWKYWGVFLFSIESAFFCFQSLTIYCIVETNLEHKNKFYIPCIFYFKCKKASCWRDGFRCRAPAWQRQSPEFKA
jgi:hypothetical protein